MHITPDETGEYTLHCPNCKEPWLHHKVIIVASRAYEDQERGLVVKHFGDGQYKVDPKASQMNISTHASMEEHNPSPRRNGLTIHFECESCDHIGVFTLIQHKGSTYLKFV